MKTYSLYIISSLLILCSSTIFAEDKVENGAFGDSKVTTITPVEKKSGECLSFEATYSESLGRKPSAYLDIENSAFANVFKALLTVIQDSTNDKKYRMVLAASTDNGKCPKIEDNSQLTLSTYSGEGADDSLQTTPNSMTFTSKHNKLTSQKSGD